jgi:hypothetical protein
MARIKEIVIDSQDPPALARFWAETLKDYAVRAYDEAEIARLERLGFTPDTDPVVMVDGPGPTLCFQRSDKTRRTRSRLHFDLVGEARTREVPRLIALGARVKEVRETYTVMLDPEGNAFCVQDPKA